MFPLIETNNIITHNTTSSPTPTHDKSSFIYRHHVIKITREYGDDIEKEFFYDRGKTLVCLEFRGHVCHIDDSDNDIL